MKIHHLNCTTMCPLGSKLLPGFFPSQVICHCLLVETSEGLVLIDTGMSQAVLQDPSKFGLLNILLGVQAIQSESVVSQLKTLGYSPKDVSHIIPTHLDNDHAGAIEDFPNAVVHVAKTELEAARRPKSLTEQFRCRLFKEHDNWLEHSLDNGENWNGFQSVKAIPKMDDEILLIPLFGHTEGHFGVAIKSSDGWIFHVGDSYYDHKEINEHAPLGLSLFMYFAHVNSKAAKHNLDMLKDLRKTNSNIQMFCAHDPHEFNKYANLGS